LDELVESKGVKILIEPTAVMHLAGTRMHFVQDELRYCVTWADFEGTSGLGRPCLVVRAAG
jgi:hypothetical protein